MQQKRAPAASQRAPSEEAERRTEAEEDVDRSPLFLKALAGAPARPAGDARAIARAGVAGADAPLPHLDRIQASFGREDVRHVRAAMGGTAADAATRLGARAYTIGPRVGFRSAPDLRLAAHEAAHVVQQRDGVQLAGGVGREGDAYEREADEVAGAVVEGRSAEPILARGRKARGAPPGALPGGSVQRACACGGTCASCSEDALQRELDPLATRETEPALRGEAAGAEPAPGGGGASGAPGRGAAAAPDGGGSPAAPGGAPDGGAPQAEDPALDAAAAGVAASRCPSPSVPTPSSSGSEDGSSEASTAPREGCTEETPHRDNRQPGTTSDGRQEPAPPEPAPVQTQSRPQSSSTSLDGGEGGAGAGGGPGGGGGGGGGGCAAGVAGGGAAPAAAPGPAGGGATAAGGAAAAPAPGPGGPTPAGQGGGGGNAEGGGAAAPQGQAESPAPQGQAEAAPAGGGEGGAAAAPEPPAADAEQAGPEAERDAAIAEYEGARQGVHQTRALLGAAGGGGVRFTPAEDSQGAQQEARAAGDVAGDMLAGGASDAATALDAVAEQVPARLGAALSRVKARIDGACLREKQAIAGHFAAARAAARRDAAAARTAVDTQFVTTTVQIMAATMRAIVAIERLRSATQGSVNTAENTQIAAIGQIVTSSQESLRGVGQARGAQAWQRGQEHWRRYHTGRIDRKDSFFDGYLTDRRAEARKRAALDTAGGYRESFVTEAAAQADQFGRGKQRACAAAARAALSARGSVDEQARALQRTLGEGMASAVADAAQLRAQLHGQIARALARQMMALAREEHAQKQAANDAAYVQKVAGEQAAHGAAAQLLRSAADAGDAIAQALGDARGSLDGSDAPASDEMRAASADARRGLADGLATLRATVGNHLDGAEQSLDVHGDSADGVLVAVGDGAGAAARASSDGFAGQMNGIRSAATQGFAGQRSGHAAQLAGLLASATAAFVSAVTGLRATFAAQNCSLREGAESQRESLDQSFGSELRKLPGDIAHYACEAANREQPAWKEVVAIVLIIAVIIIAAVVLGPLAAALGGGLLATIAAGAIVGAVAGMAMQAINNWSTGQSLTRGLLRAAVIGAIGGAIGGAGAAWIGGASTFGSFVVRNLVVNLAAEAGRQITQGIIDGRFRFDGHGVAMAIGWALLSSLLGAGRFRGPSAPPATAAPRGPTTLRSVSGPNAGRSVKVTGTRATRPAGSVGSSGAARPPARAAAPARSQPTQLRPQARAGGPEPGMRATGTGDARPLPAPEPAPQTAPQPVPEPVPRPAPAPSTQPAPVAPPRPPLWPVLPARPVQPPPAPSPGPSPGPRPEPPQNTLPGPGPSPGPGPGPSPGPGPAPAPAPDPTNPSNKPRRPITLTLPPEKTQYQNLYSSFVRQRLLQHRPGRNRDTQQAGHWDDLMTGGEMSLGTYCRGLLTAANTRLAPYPGRLRERDVLRPHWARRVRWPDMQVDHRIEMQVTTIGGEDQFDAAWNYELRDRGSNGNSGNNLKQNIIVERQQLAAYYGSPLWNTIDITFDRVATQAGVVNAGVWTFEQVAQGEHLDQYDDVTGEPGPSDEEIQDCEARGGRL
ncbi:eCIS core domain-containing protein [Sorangium sp. So ce861]|uniref:eCIS core domain-containing protein n=1 Tax=Sorangium sp. So ce861 TaxID=3133323 RepID=UPI003F62E6B0